MDNKWEMLASTNANILRELYRQAIPLSSIVELELN